MNMKSTTFETTFVKMLQLKNGLKVVILAWWTKNALGGSKSLNIRNWKYYLMRIVAKH